MLLTNKVEFFDEVPPDKEEVERLPSKYAKAHEGPAKPIFKKYRIGLAENGYHFSLDWLSFDTMEEAQLYCTNNQGRYMTKIYPIEAEKVGKLIKG